MKLWHIIIYGALIFLVSFASLSVTASLVTEYLMPPWTPTLAAAYAPVSDLMTMTNTFFSRALAFSFFIFLLLFSPIVVSFIFKTSVILNLFISIVVGIILWVIVKIFASNLFSIFYSSIGKDIYSIDYNPLYTSMSFTIGGVIVIILFLFSFVSTTDRQQKV